MELLQLQYFREIARSGHLSRTAEKLHIAQPSLSQTLKRLEDELGVRLFDRTGKRLVLNEYGRIFLKYTDQVFHALDNARLELDTIRHMESKTVSLQIRSASMLLPELVQAIQKADPEIRLQIFQHSAEQRAAGQCLCITSSYQLPAENESVSVLMKEAVKAAIPKGHRLAEKENICLADLKDETFLSLSPSSALAELVAHYCGLAGFTHRITTYVDTPAVMRDLLKVSPMLAFVPERTWQGFAFDNVVLKTVEDMPMERYLLLQWDAAEYQTPSMKLCRQIIEAYFAAFTKENLQSQEEGAR